MTYQVQTLERFRRFGRSHLASARHIISAESSANPKVMLPGTAAYLVHVALECVLKAHLLYRNGCWSKEELENKQPQIHRALFTGRRGHNLELVSQFLSLPALMTRGGRTWHEDEIWGRIASDDRPYSLRYGAEAIKVTEAVQELDRAEDIIATVLAATGPVRLSGKQRKRN